MAHEEGENLRQAVFGANDGLVSTFGLVAGLVGAAVSKNVLIVANIVNMIAAGMSMGLGSYLATKSQVEYHRRIVKCERDKIKHERREALRELRWLFKRRGVPASALKRHMDAVTDDENEWLEFILENKHGLGKASFPNPIKGGIIMFFVFVSCGLIPIMPLFFVTGTPGLVASALITGVALFVVGAMKQKLTGRSWFSLGMENLLIGAITGTVGFIAGILVVQWL